jgi:hypothetical protein
MSLFDRLRADATLTVRSDRHRRKLTRAIADRLVDLETTAAKPIEIQPLPPIPPLYGLGCFVGGDMIRNSPLPD